MGYQIVEVQVQKTYFERRPEYLLVLNAEFADEILEPVRRLDGTLYVRKGSGEKALQELTHGSSFRVLSESSAQSLGLIEKTERQTSTRPASDNPVEMSKSEEQFLRFSAYANDRRIKPDGSVLPGTYVTTMADGMMHVKTGMDAVRRYALPNPAPADHRFHMEPPYAIAIRRGIVAPANGQPGGGVEVIFENGAPAKTTYKHDQIPPG
jgi:hypothetical protein